MAIQDGLKRAGSRAGVAVVHAYSRDRDWPRCGARIIRDRWFRTSDPGTCERFLALEGRVR